MNERFHGRRGVAKWVVLLLPAVAAGCSTGGVCPREAPRTAVERQNLLQLPEGCELGAIGAGGAAELLCEGGRTGYAIVGAPTEGNETMNRAEEIIDGH